MDDRRIDALRAELEQREIELLAQKNMVRVAERKARHLASQLEHTQVQLTTATNTVERLETELEHERKLRHMLDTQQRALALQFEQRAAADAQEARSTRAQIDRLEVALADARRGAASLQEKIAWEHEENKVRIVELERLSRIETQYTELCERPPPLQTFKSSEEMVQLLAELQWENASLANRAQDLETQLESVREANHKDHQLLQALQHEQRLDRDKHKQKQHQPRGSDDDDDDDGDDGNEFENLGNLQAISEPDFPLPLYDEEFVVPPPPPPPPLSPPMTMMTRDQERDAAFEFFSLTILAVKVHFGQKVDSLLTVSTQDLWLRAKEQSVQFYDYYSWIEDQMTLAYVASLKEIAAAVAIQQQQHEQHSCNTAALRGRISKRL